MTLRPSARIELHLHLEGALALQDAARLASRQGLSGAGLPGLYQHRDFREFLAHFGALVSLLREPEDLVNLLGKTLQRLKRQRVIYAEIRVSPAVWERHGLEPCSIMAALARAKFSDLPEYRLIVDSVRQWDKTLILRDLELALAHKRSGVVALGLGGDEAAAPAEGFMDIAERCHRERIGFIPHAGEALGPEEVLAAAELPGVRRVGHGVSAARSQEAMQVLAAQQTHLEVCPTSNYCTGAVAAGEAHPVGALFRSGIALSISTDDPALFSTTLAKEEQVAKKSGLSRRDILVCRANAAMASFLSKPEREALARLIGN